MPHRTNALSCTVRNGRRTDNQHHTCQLFPPAGICATQAQILLDVLRKMRDQYLASLIVLSKLLAFPNYQSFRISIVKITCVQITSQFELVLSKLLVNANY
jgi:hypothetical protein